MGKIIVDKNRIFEKKEGNWIYNSWNTIWNVNENEDMHQILDSILKKHGDSFTLELEVGYENIYLDWVEAIYNWFDS